MAFVPALAPANLRAAPGTLRRSSFVSSAPPRQAAAAERAPAARRVRIQPACSDMGVKFPDKKHDASLRIGVISTRWNAEYVDAMAGDVKATLAEKGITDDNVVVMQVPGAYELPIAARLMCAAQKVDAIVCVGVLIKGETDHYEYIASAVSSGIMDLQLTLSIPIMFGVLCCESAEQAEARSIGEKSNAKEWALTAVEMAHLRKSQLGGVGAGKKSVGFF